MVSRPPDGVLLAREFLDELRTTGRIYGYRFRPPGRIWGKPIEQHTGRTIEGRAFQVMIDNNLDFEVALYPYELVTYGETGRVCQNWMQYHLIRRYLQELKYLIEDTGRSLQDDIDRLEQDLLPPDDPDVCSFDAIKRRRFGAIHE